MQSFEPHTFTALKMKILQECLLIFSRVSRVALKTHIVRARVPEVSKTMTHSKSKILNGKFADKKKLQDDR